MHLIFINSNEYNPISDSECLHFTIYENFTFCLHVHLCIPNKTSMHVQCLVITLRTGENQQTTESISAIFSKYCQ